MANGQAYHNHDLVFANEPVDLQTPRLSLGDPCPAMLQREFPKVVAAAGVRLIKVHGTRHTAATLLLQAAVPVQVVAQRLGHADITETLNTYAHALPDMQRDATKLGVLLTGR
jgi:integrase